MKFISIIILTSLPLMGLSQGVAQFSLEATTGVELGWWLHNRGADVAGVDNNLGWDRTDVSINMPNNIVLWLRIYKWSLGIGYGHNLYFEDLMEQYEDRPTRFRRYRISKNAVTIQQFYFSTEYEMVKTGNYSLSPSLAVGLFNENSTHPDRDNFDHQLSWAFGLTNTVKRGRVDFVIRPRLQMMATKLKSGGNINEDYHFRFFGFSLGARYVLSK